MRGHVINESPLWIFVENIIVAADLDVQLIYNAIFVIFSEYHGSWLATTHYKIAVLLKYKETPTIFGGAINYIWIQSGSEV